MDKIYETTLFHTLENRQSRSMTSEREINKGQPYNCTILPEGNFQAAIQKK